MQIYLNYACLIFCTSKRLTDFNEVAVAPYLEVRRLCPAIGNGRVQPAMKQCCTYLLLIWTFFGVRQCKSAWFFPPGGYRKCILRKTQISSILLSLKKIPVLGPCGPMSILVKYVWPHVLVFIWPLTTWTLIRLTFSKAKYHFGLYCASAGVDGTKMVPIVFLLVLHWVLFSEFSRIHCFLGLWQKRMGWHPQRSPPKCSSRARVRKSSEH